MKKQAFLKQLENHLECLPITHHDSELTKELCGWLLKGELKRDRSGALHWQFNTPSEWLQKRVDHPMQVKMASSLNVATLNMHYNLDSSFYHPYSTDFLAKLKREPIDFFKFIENALPNLVTCAPFCMAIISTLGFILNAAYNRDYEDTFLSKRGGSRAAYSSIQKVAQVEDPSTVAKLIDNRGMSGGMRDTLQPFKECRATDHAMFDALHRKYRLEAMDELALDEKAFAELTPENQEKSLFELLQRAANDAHGIEDVEIVLAVVKFLSHTKPWQHSLSLRGTSTQTTLNEIRSHLECYVKEEQLIGLLNYPLHTPQPDQEPRKTSFYGPFIKHKNMRALERLMEARRDHTESPTHEQKSKSCRLLEMCASVLETANCSARGKYRAAAINIQQEIEKQEEKHDLLDALKEHYEIRRETELKKIFEQCKPFFNMDKLTHSSRVLSGSLLREDRGGTKKSPEATKVRNLKPDQAKGLSLLAQAPPKRNRLSRAHSAPPPKKARLSNAHSAPPPPKKARLGKARSAPLTVRISPVLSTASKNDEPTNYKALFNSSEPNDIPGNCMGYD